MQPNFFDPIFFKILGNWTDIPIKFYFLILPYIFEYEFPTVVLELEIDVMSL